ncbi:MAG: hypothetical protein ACR65O_00380 [Methylomicrobium sp.]
MANKNEIEQELVTEFCSFIEQHGDETFAVDEIHNGSGDTKFYADIELTTTSGELIAIEAKTHETRDAPNTVHKVFGQLLAEHGKTNPQREILLPKFGILIPAETPTNPHAPKSCGRSYYQRRFRDIPELKFEQFGQMVNAKYVFVFKRSGPKRLDVYHWMDFHRMRDPITTITTENEILREETVA